MFHMYVIYFDATDFPGLYVAREFTFPESGQPLAGVTQSGDSIGALRDWIADHSRKTGYVCNVPFTRHPDDEPHIVEVWI